MINLYYVCQILTYTSVAFATYQITKDVITLIENSLFNKIETKMKKNGINNKIVLDKFIHIIDLQRINTPFFSNVVYSMKLFVSWHMLKKFYPMLLKKWENNLSKDVNLKKD